MIKREAKIDIELSILELAQEFCELDADGMAVFFEWVGVISDKWVEEGGSLNMQLQGVADSDLKTSKSTTVMKMIGEYA